MKVKFNIRVQDKVLKTYWEAGETYDIADKSRVDFIVANGWGKLAKEDRVKPAEEVLDNIATTIIKERKPKTVE